MSQLVASRSIVIDRPKGSRHLHYPDMIYPLDYGYLSNTTSTDGHELDVWVGTQGGRQVSGVICTVDLGKGDSEIKVCMDCTDADMQTILRFLNDNSLGCLLVKPHLQPDIEGHRAW